MVVDPVEERLDDARFLALAIALEVDERAHLQPAAAAEDARDDEHALQVERHEVALVARGAIGDLGGVDLGIARRRIGAAQEAQSGDVGDRLDVEGEDQLRRRRLRASAQR